MAAPTPAAGEPGAPAVIEAPVDPAADPTSAADGLPQAPTEPTEPGDDPGALGAYCTIPKAVLPVTDSEGDAEGSDDDSNSIDGRLEDGECVPD